MNSRYLQFLGLVGALAGAQLGCGDSTEDVVKGRAVGLDHMTQQAGLGSGALASIQGTYGTHCENRMGDTWTALVGGGSVLDPLTVRTGDTDCDLALTGVTMTGAPLVSLEASMPIPLALGYAMVAASFPKPGPLLFYANAALSSAGFTTDFDINVVYSDSKDATEDLDNTGNPVIVHPNTVTAGNVPAPAYTLDVTEVHVGIDTHSNPPVIVNVTGTGALSVTQEGQTGEKYVIVDTLADPHTYETINAAYTDTGVTPVSLSVDPALIPPESFDLVQDPELELPQDRFLIVAHTEHDVTSYQVFTIHFHGWSECGNALIESDEPCDDGNVTNGDRCSSTCQIEVWGNGVVDLGETCDDGNLTNGDHCSSTCQIE